jgi:hypothetical protein
VVSVAFEVRGQVGGIGNRFLAAYSDCKDVSCHILLCAFGMLRRSVRLLRLERALMKMAVKPCGLCCQETLLVLGLRSRLSWRVAVVSRHEAKAGGAKDYIGYSKERYALR